MICPNCKTVDIPEIAKYCPNCGIMLCPSNSAHLKLELECDIVFVKEEFSRFQAYNCNLLGLIVYVNDKRVVETDIKSYCYETFCVKYGDVIKVMGINSGGLRYSLFSKKVTKKMCKKQSHRITYERPGLLSIGDVHFD